MARNARVLPEPVAARAAAEAPELVATLERAVPWLARLIADGGHKGCAMPGDAVATLRRAEAVLARIRGEAPRDARP